MPTLYVYLYEDGKMTSFGDLSGQEMRSVEDASGMDFDSDDDEDYATVSVTDEEFSTLVGKKDDIKPRQYGLNKWGRRVQLQYLASPNPEMVDRAKSAQGVFGLGPKGIPQLNADVEAKVAENLTGIKGSVEQQKQALRKAIIGKGGTRKRKTRTRGKKVRKTTRRR